MPFKPNYQVGRSERTRSKALKKQEKQEAKAARRTSGRDAMPSSPEYPASVPTDLNEEDDGPERSVEKEG